MAKNSDLLENSKIKDMIRFIVEKNYSVAKENYELLLKKKIGKSMEERKIDLAKSVFAK